MKSLALIVSLLVLGNAAAAAGIDSRAYSCAELHSLIAARGFIFISQATFGDFAVANDSFCSGADIVESRSVATHDSAECPINYCVPRNMGGSGSM